MTEQALGDLVRQPTEGGVAILGGESTGKTWLAGQLATTLGVLALPEVLRSFTAHQGRPPLQHEQQGLIHQQIREEARLAAEAGRSNGSVSWIADSSPLAVALYSVLYFADDSLVPLAVAHQRSYALTLVTATDLPWQADGVQRDSPAMRDRFTHLLLATLREHGVAYHEIRGQGPARLAAAMAVIRPGEGL